MALRGFSMGRLPSPMVAAVDPAQAEEATAVGVAGEELGLLLDGVRRQLGIGRQVRHGPDRLEETARLWVADGELPVWSPAI